MNFDSHFCERSTVELNAAVAKVENGDWTRQIKESRNLGQLQCHCIDDGLPTPKADCDLADFGIKQKLRDPFIKLNKDVRSAGGTKEKKQSTSMLTPFQSELLCLMSSYRDITFPLQTHENSHALRNAYLLHCLNHVLKTRDRVLANNAKLSAGTRDQGFTRPKILILVPTRNVALQLIQNIMALYESATVVQNKARLMKEFGIDEDEDHLDERKPEDHKQDFAGNIDDCFRIGIKISRKAMKLFSDFYKSDIIIASTLGLRMVIGAEDEPSRDFDFLSSIEVLVMDRMDFFLMQNFDHVKVIMKHLNLTPSDPHGCDFSRVREWYLNGQAKYLRQTVLLSQYVTPEINAMFNQCKNVAGKVKFYKEMKGSIAQVMVQMPQIFYKIPDCTFVDADNTRFEYFTGKILPILNRSVTKLNHTLIFIPAYFDYVRVRNYMKDHNYNFAELCEYTSNNDISRNRLAFFKGQVGFVLYTERFHFYRRYKIRGVHHLVFYGLPENSVFYPELVNMAEKASDCSCSVIISKFDKMKLERTVGSRRLEKVMEKETVLFT